VHQSQIRSGELDNVVIPDGLSKCEEFRKDLNMGNAYWFYHKYGQNEMKRVLLLQKQEDKEDAKEHDIRKSYR